MTMAKSTVSSTWASLRGNDSQYTRASRRGRQQRRGKVTARCCYLFVPVHLPEAQTFFLSSASLPAGIYCWSKIVVAAFVVTAVVMVSG